MGKDISTSNKAVIKSKLKIVFFLCIVIFKFQEHLKTMRKRECVEILLDLNDGVEESDVQF